MALAGNCTGARAQALTALRARNDANAASPSQFFLLQVLWGSPETASYSQMQAFRSGTQL